MLEKLLLILVGALLASFGYLAKRLFENKPVMEHIEKSERLLALKKNLDSSSITVEDLSTFEDVLLGRAKAAAKISSDYEQQAEDVAKSIQQDNLTQVELNQIAIGGLRLAEVELDALIDEFVPHLSREELDAFLLSQESWTQYRESYAQFVADRYAGGSIQPLIHASALEAATSNRIAELKIELQDRQL